MLPTIYYICQDLWEIYNILKILFLTRNIYHYLTDLSKNLHNLDFYYIFYLQMKRKFAMIIFFFQLFPIFPLVAATITAATYNAITHCTSIVVDIKIYT
jgi:hypothetical protein